MDYEALIESHENTHDQSEARKRDKDRHRKDREDRTNNGMDVEPKKTRRNESPERGRDYRYDNRDKKRDRSRERRESRRKRSSSSSGSPEFRQRKDRNIKDEPKTKEDESGGGLRELNVDEMNALRATLGLKPLTPNKPREEPQPEEPIKQESIDVEDKIKMIREKREKREQEKIFKGKNLGDSDSEDDSAASWIMKSRRQKELKEQEATAKKLLSKLEESEDVSSDSDDPIAFKMQQYQKKKAQNQQKRNIKKEDDDYDPQMILGHSLEDLEVANGGYLTLADKPILKAVKSDQYEVDDEDDEVENIAIREKEKLRHYSEIKAGKGKYNANDDNDGEILSKYDDDIDKPKKGSLVVKSGILQDQKALEIKKKIEESAKNMNLVIGHEKLREASDFYTKDEILKFKKTKKERVKKGKRQRPTSLADELIPLSTNFKLDSDLATGASRRERQRETNLKEVIESLEKRNSYQQAIDKINEESKWAFQNHDIIEDEDESLYRSLAKARNLTLKKKKFAEDEIVAAVENARHSEMEVEEHKGKNTLFLNATTEFAKSVPTLAQTQAQEEEDDSIAAALKRKAQHKKRTLDLIDKVVVSDHLKVVKPEENDPDYGINKPENDITTMLVGDVPLVNVGLAATLEFLRKRGGADIKENVTVKSRPTDANIDVDNTDDVIIERRDSRGRLLSTKQAFREQSYKFHGKAPGKKKIAKQLRREQEEMARRALVSDGFEDQRLDILKKTQIDSALPYVVMQGSTTKILEQRQKIAENVQERQLEKSLKKGPK